MDEEVKVNYPEKIWIKMVENFEEKGNLFKEWVKKLGL